MPANRKLFLARSRLGGKVMLSAAVCSDFPTSPFLDNFRIADHPTTGLVRGHKVRLPGTDPASTLS